MGDRVVLTRHCWVSSRARARTPCRPSPTTTNPRAPTDRIRHLTATFRPSHPFPPQGCGTALNVPKLPSGGDSPAFKCVWCEAVNETTPRSRHGRVRWNLEHTFTRWGGRVLVAGVVVIALAVARAPVARFAPVVHSRDPWVVSFDNFLSDDEAERIALRIASFQKFVPFFLGFVVFSIVVLVLFCANVTPRYKPRESQQLKVYNAQ